MFFSIVIPVYNMEKYLKKCIDSVLSQDFDSYEICAVDDGSSDSSLEILNSYAEQHPSVIKVFTQTNAGQGFARNTGIKNAVGDYILFLDSDDFFEPETLKKIHATLCDTKCDIGVFGIKYYSEDGKILDIRNEYCDKCEVFKPEDKPYLFVDSSYVCKQAYKRELFDEPGCLFPKRGWYEDLCAGSIIYVNANSVVTIPDVYYGYLQRAGSTMHNSRVEKNSDMLDTVRDIKNYVFEKYDSTSVWMQMVEYVYVFHLMSLCTMRVASCDIKNHLISEFYDEAISIYPDIKNSELKNRLPKKYRVVFELSVRKKYRLINLMYKVKEIFSSI